MIPDPLLFLAFPLGKDFLNVLDAVPVEKRQFFINDSSTYLEEYQEGNERYFGKRVGSITDWNSLKNLEINIYSLLRKLVSNYPYESSPLKLLIIHHE